MSNVLDTLQQARPDVAAPSHAVRSSARQRLLAVIEDEPVGLHARHHRRVPAAGRDVSAPAASPPPGRRPEQEARRRVIGRWVAGRLTSVAVVAIAAVVVIVALAIPAHRQAGVPTHDAGGRGVIDARGGQALTQGGTGLPAVITAGLRSHYRAKLSGGRTLQTTIDMALQRAAMQGLRHSVTVNHAAGGTVVALDPQTGAVQAIAITGPNGRAARVDSAVSDAAATGGVFMPVTALAALQTGAWTPGETYVDTGKFCLPESTVCLYNSGRADYGTLTLARALAVQSDVFSFQLAAKLNSSKANGGALQQTARQLEIGRRSGIDLPDEARGTLPTPATLARNRPPRHWSLGDALNLAVGQGQLAVTPIQLAVAYAAIANGDAIITPHLATAVTGHGSSDRLPSSPSHHLTLARPALATVRQGLRQNATNVFGRSADVLASLHEPIAGAVGSTQTIEHGRETTNGWYAGFIQDAKHPLVVIINVQSGGFGDVSAAPIARQLFSQWTTGHPGRWIPGRSTAQ